MLDRQTNPLDIARTVLKPETIHDLKVRGFTNSAYLILDRWALNSPDELKRLEAEGNQAIEKRTLCSESARQASLRGMSDWEILESCGVEMNLKITG